MILEPKILSKILSAIVFLAKGCKQIIGNKNKQLQTCSPSQSRNDLTPPRLGPGSLQEWAKTQINKFGKLKWRTDGRTWTDGHGHGRTDMDVLRTDMDVLRTDLKDTQIPGSLQLQWAWEEEDSWSAWRCQSVATATVKMILVVIIENLRAFISYYYPFDRLNCRSHKANNDWCWVIKFYFELR